ncbi:MAG: M67 family metallopeptidase [Actinomycetota bacterium]
MMLEEFRVPRAVANEMIAHCEAGRPNEACGILAGKTGEVVKHYPITNAAASPVRYALEPQEQFTVDRTIEAEGLEVAGAYHSHTRTEAYPSPTDVRLASLDVPYVIVSLAGKRPSIRAFLIEKEDWLDDHGTIREVPVAII